MEDQEYCQQLQQEEIISLSAIYGAPHVSWSKQADETIIILKDVFSAGSLVECSLPLFYPIKSVPSMQILDSSVPRTLIDQWTCEAHELALSYMGNVCIFQMMEHCLQNFNSYQHEETFTTASSRLEEEEKEEEEEEKAHLKSSWEENPLEEHKVWTCRKSANLENQAFPLLLAFHTLPTIYSGSVVTDRKSGFQAYLGMISKPDDISFMLSKLAENKKVAQATHRIMAYRISVAFSMIAQDFDDDGETGAGQRLLFLLKTMKVMNVCIVVARWFGGIRLGNDRFKHIQNVARCLIEQHRAKLQFES
jgi:hypothetical protein